MKNSINTPLDKPIFENQEDAQREQNSWGFKIRFCHNKYKEKIKSVLIQQ
jgi:hypothetical protein